MNFYLRHYDRTVIELYRRMGTNHIRSMENPIVDRDFASLVIETLMLRGTIGLVYTYENVDGDHIVIDGNKRVVSIREYIRGEFALQGLEFLSEFNGYTFDKLPQQFQNRIEDATIDIRYASSDIDFNLYKNYLERV